jgi:hypothetical protein
VFTNVLGSLTTALPRYFIFGSYVPTLLALAFNAGFLYVQFAPFREFVGERLRLPTAVAIAALFLATVVVAYIASALSDTARQALEGRSWPRRFAGPFVVDEVLRRNSIAERYETARFNRVWIRRCRSEWRDKLEAAADRGRRAHPGKQGHTMSQNLAKHFKKTEATLQAQKIVLYTDLASLIDAAEAELENFDDAVDTKATATRSQLLSVIDQSIISASAREQRSGLQLRQNYGVGEPYPTTFGNIGASPDAYTVPMYGLEVDAFWSALQTVLRKSDDKAYTALQDVKTQLDFIILSFWYSVLTAVWVFPLANAGQVYATAVIGGACLTLATCCYLLALQTYRTYADLLRACIDVNRFSLLRALHVPLPGSAAQERRIWQALFDASRDEGPTGFGFDHSNA